MLNYLPDEFEIPSFLIPYLHTTTMERLKGCDMNCGVQYTSLPLFSNLTPYSRYEHSFRAAMLLWHFTQDQKMTLAGLFHDCATPAFSHVVDFMYDDFETQEVTETKTEEILQNDTEIVTQLKQQGFTVYDVSDYHLYPPADLPSSKLCADRLEYTCGNLINYGFASLSEVQSFLKDLIIMNNEEGQQEFVFQHVQTAKQFANLALQCAKVYSSVNDRYSMYMLSRILKQSIADGIITNDDLWQTEQHVIRKLCDANLTKWYNYTRLSNVAVYEQQVSGSICLKVKKRYLDPMVVSGKRVSALDDQFQKELLIFQNDQMNAYMKGNTI